MFKKKSWVKITVEIGIFTVLSVTILFFLCKDCMSSTEAFLKSMVYSLAIWISLWQGNAYLSCWLDLRISWFKFPVKRLVVGLITMTVYTTLMVYFLILAFQWVFNSQWSNEVIFDNIKFSLLITVIISAFMHARFFLANWKKSELDAEKMKNERLSSKYETLKNQINPHFLFNSFNALVDLIYHDQDMAAKFVKQLSVVYRYVLEQQHKEVVPLEDELAFVKSYLFLEKIRYGDNLHVNYSIDIEAPLNVPPLSIQMLIENAIKHNIISRDEPLTIDIKIEDNEYIVVSNNLQKKQVSMGNSTGVGLKNIKARYEFLTTKLVHILEGKNHFTVKLPFLQIQAE